MNALLVSLFVYIHIQTRMPALIPPHPTPPHPGMFNDPTFQVGVTVDKRGRKIKSQKRAEDMRRYYHLKDEDEWKNDKEGDEDGGEEEQPVKKAAAEPINKNKNKEEEEDTSEEEEKDAAAVRWARIRGLAGPETSSTEEDDDEEVETEDETEEEEEDFETEEESTEGEGQDVEEFGVGAFAANPQESIPLLPDATHRLACVDLDWDHITAVDILVALKSFVPGGGPFNA